MKILNPDQIREIDQRAIAEYGIPSRSLMQKAGEGVGKIILNVLKKRCLCGPIGIFTGKGNNGGDGFSAACFLAAQGIKSRIFSLYPERELTGDAPSFYRDAKTLKEVEILDAHQKTFFQQHAQLISECPILVDAILGTGFKGKPHGIIAEAIEYINILGRFIVAIDVPSGLDANTGKAQKAVRADVTATMGFCKSGFLMGQAMNYVGSLKVIDIGIPPKVVESVPSPYHLLHPETVGAVLAHRLRISHKGDYGHLLIVGGSYGMSGAATLCARAALRSGSGLVTVACPASVQPIVAQSVSEAMTLGLAENTAKMISSSAIDSIHNALETRKYSAIVLGPGIGHDKDTQKFVIKALLELDIPMVLDADALFAIAYNRVDLKKAKSRRLILTPHVGEFSRLLGKQKSKNMENQQVWGNARVFSAKNRCIVVVKSHITAISNGESGEFICTEGNPGMATAGMGDVLSGVIGSFLGQGLSPLDAATAGVFVHAHAGDIASDRKGHYGLVASDVIEALPNAILDLPLRR